MPLPRRKKTIIFASTLAALFGVATLAASTRVLLGADPGYTVYRPLLLFNAVMGLAYVIVGILAWIQSRLSVWASAAIALVNLVALAAIAWVYFSEGQAALQSLFAMAFRAGIWALLFVLLYRALGPVAAGGKPVA